jgi:hypothetical protein
LKKKEDPELWITHLEVLKTEMKIYGKPYG